MTPPAWASSLRDPRPELDLVHAGPSNRARDAHERRAGLRLGPERRETTRSRTVRSARRARASPRSGRVWARPPTPRSNGYGGFTLGLPALPLRALTSAVSSPATKPSGIDAIRQSSFSRRSSKRCGEHAALDGSAPRSRDRDDDVPCTERVRSGGRTVEHEVRDEPHERPILAARRLAFRCVDDDHRADALRGDRGELVAGRESPTASAAKSARPELR